ncbi:MAG: threonylcarbamoyl-AMP synthase [Gammaproteobacteria bacterium]|nr:MAG: threonylcarbamoyl-AMP synthase [Gammaproteobacteria bacterium]
MSQYFQIHPDNPQPRLIRQAVGIIRQGGIIAYPTDSSYALGCHIGDRTALERLRRLRGLDEKHNFTLVCRDLSELSRYAVVDNIAYRLIRSHTPGPYTFILRASREVPRRLMTPRRKTIGLRVPDHPIVKALLDELGEPILSTTLILPGDELPLNDPEEIRARLGRQIDLVIDGGPCPQEPTTVIELVEEPRVLRLGRGPVDFLEA